MNDSMLDRQTLAARLRLARERAGLSQGQVAKMLEYHRPTISEIEAARRRVSGEELARLANIYDVDIAWLTAPQSARTVDEDRVQLAARELAKLKPEDLKRVEQLLASLRRSGGKAK